MIHTVENMPPTGSEYLAWRLICVHAGRCMQVCGLLLCGSDSKGEGGSTAGGTQSETWTIQRWILVGKRGERSVKDRPLVHVMPPKVMELCLAPHTHHVCPVPSLLSTCYLSCRPSRRMPFTLRYVSSPPRIPFYVSILQGLTRLQRPWQATRPCSRLTCPTDGSLTGYLRPLPNMSLNLPATPSDIPLAHEFRA